MARNEAAVTSELSAGKMSVEKQNIFKRLAEYCCIADDESIYADLICRKQHYLSF